MAAEPNGAAHSGLLIDWVSVDECQPTTYEAEGMFHSTGGATTGGWNIWSNGYISTKSRETYWFRYSQITGQLKHLTIDAENWPAMEGRSLAGNQSKCRERKSFAVRMCV